MDLAKGSVFQIGLHGFQLYRTPILRIEKTNRVEHVSHLDLLLGALPDRWAPFVGPA